MPIEIEQQCKKDHACKKPTVFFMLELKQKRFFLLRCCNKDTKEQGDEGPGISNFRLYKPTPWGMTF
ncbi:MAG TPA: hypothetical protein VFV31_12585 [Chitinophagaceae bacterium]|nr:hypothetical protein [Chitinophagaceae bacterium]